jgi:hypothetical protein
MLHTLGFLHVLTGLALSRLIATKMSGWASCGRCNFFRKIPARNGF